MHETAHREEEKDPLAEGDDRPLVEDRERHGLAQCRKCVSQKRHKQRQKKQQAAAHGRQCALSTRVRRQRKPQLALEPQRDQKRKQIGRNQQAELNPGFRAESPVPKHEQSLARKGRSILNELGLARKIRVHVQPPFPIARRA